MKIPIRLTFVRAVLVGAFLWALSFDVHGETVFSEDFESGSLGAVWQASGMSDGRVTVSGDFAPASGTHHLMLDDSSSDSNFSVAEATLVLDLSFKKGAVLTFDAKSIGNEPHPAPVGNFSAVREYDGVAISTDGGTTWRTVQSLENLGSSWQTFSLPLDGAVAALGGSFGSGFRIRFSEYDNAAVPVDGIAIDNIRVEAEVARHVLVDVPSPLVEGSGPHTGYLLLDVPSETPLTFVLAASPSGQVAIPSSVMVPSGQTYAPFAISVVDNDVVDLARSVSISASASEYAGTAASVTVLDDDTPTLSLNVPAKLVEGETPTGNSTLSVDRAPAVALVCSLSADPMSEVVLPASVTIPAGKTSVTFSIGAYNDLKIDGDIPVTVNASVSGGVSATADSLAVDDERRTLALPFSLTLTEGGSGDLSVSIPGILQQDLQVGLAASDAAVVSVPTTVVIPAGSTSASVAVTALDNTLKDGTRTPTITATAPSFAAATSAITVRDNEVAGYKFGSLGVLLTISSPVSISISAVDVEGNVISGASAAVSLGVVLPDSSVQPLTPSPITLAGALGWTGAVNLPPIPDAPLRLRASDADGNIGYSTVFDTLRVLPLTTADLLWDAARSRFYATVPASSTSSYANMMIAIDPTTGQITGSLVLNQDPGQMVMTSDGGTVYVAHNANGMISRVRLADMTVVSTFAV
ncbi:MAG TPA: hypothetical protein VK178_15275, partial [Opitutaceae bacterium]|nr:hypothetical protein [Opitutaceae bacterium]